MAFYGVFLMWWWCNTKTKENLHSIQQSMKIYLVSARLAIWENRNSHDTLRYRTAVITHKNPTWKICRSKLPHFQHTLKIAKKKLDFHVWLQESYKNCIELKFYKSSKSPFIQQMLVFQSNVSEYFRKNCFRWNQV